MLCRSVRRPGRKGPITIVGRDGIEAHSVTNDVTTTQCVPITCQADKAERPHPGLRYVPSAPVLSESPRIRPLRVNRVGSRPLLTGPLKANDPTLSIVMQASEKPAQRRKSRGRLAHIGRRARITRLPLEPAFGLEADLIQMPWKRGARSWNAKDSAILILRFQPSVSAVTACRGSMVRRTTRSQSPPFVARSISESIFSTHRPATATATITA